MFLEAFVRLGVARAAIRLVSGQRITGWMGERQYETPADMTATDVATAEAIGRAITRASRYTPWSSVCLPQAMVAKAMLRRRGLTSTVYFGLSRASETSMNAHAWTRSGPVIVTGAREAATHTRVACFGDRRDDGRG